MDSIDESVVQNREAFLAILGSSWEEVQKRPEERNGGKGSSTMSGSAKGVDQEKQDKEGGGYPTSDAKAAPQKKKSMFGSMFSSSKKGQQGDAAEASASSSNQSSTKQGMSAFDVPQTFNEMVKLNAAMTGSNTNYILIMLDGWNDIVCDVIKYGELREQADILALRIAKDVKEKVKTSEFKVCMMASLRSLIPGRWDTQHEQAWLWLWDSVDALLGASLQLPKKYDKKVDSWVNGLERQERRDLSMSVWKRMFAADPQTESFFKQSNERLIFIVEKALEFSAKIYAAPTQVDTEIRALGLRHIMFGAQPKNFSLFVKMMEEELKDRKVEDTTIDGIIWTLTIIACIMSRTVEEGSTPILMAALSNNPKQLKKVLGQQPRGNRSQSMLSAQQK